MLRLKFTNLTIMSLVSFNIMHFLATKIIDETRLCTPFAPLKEVWERCPPSESDTRHEHICFEWDLETIVFCDYDFLFKTQMSLVPTFDIPKCLIKFIDI